MHYGRFWKWSSGFIALITFVLGLPILVKEGVSGWREWFRVADQWLGDMILYQWIGPIATWVGIAAVTAWVLVYYPPKPLRNMFHRNMDLFEELSCHEVACLCAGVRLKDSELDSQQVQEWIKRLCEEGSAYSKFPIGEYTRRAFGEWLETVSGICSAQNEPMPSYFRRAQKTIMGAMHD